MAKEASLQAIKVAAQVAEAASIKAAKVAVDATTANSVAHHEAIVEASRVAEEAARLARTNADQTRATLDRIDAQADRIHTLVNSDMTAARQDELDQANATLDVLRRVIGVARDKNIEPDPMDLDALERTERRRISLEQILADRRAAQDAVDRQASRSDASQQLSDESTEAAQQKTLEKQDVIDDIARSGNDADE